MRETTKEFVKLTVVLVALFLVVTHFRGTSRVLNTGFRGWGGIIRDFQGRGNF